MTIIGNPGKNQAEDMAGRKESKGSKEVSCGVLDAKEEEPVTSWFPDKKSVAHEQRKEKSPSLI